MALTWEKWITLLVMQAYLKTHDQIMQKAVNSHKPNWHKNKAAFLIQPVVSFKIAFFLEQ